MMGGLSQGSTGLGQINMVVGNTTGTMFKIDLPPGAKVVAIGGTADEYVRCLFTYYRI